jgi:hypothetical protein
MLSRLQLTDSLRSGYSSSRQQSADVIIKVIFALGCVPRVHERTTAAAA